MPEYMSKFIETLSDDNVIDLLVMEAGDTEVVKVKFYEWDGNAFVLVDADSVTAVLESYDESGGYSTITNATIYHEDTGIYKVVFTADCLPGTYYLKVSFTKDGFVDLDRLKVKVKVDV